MPISPKDWPVSFAANDEVKLPCPGCLGVVRPDVPNFVLHHDPDTKRASQDERWEGEFETWIFAGFLECERKEACGQVVAVAGECTIREDDDPEYAEEQGPPNRTMVYAPKHMYPAPPLMRAAKKWPPKVVAALERAFASFWFDYSACANSLRRAVEAMMTQQKVVKYGVGKKSQKVQLHLAARIAKWRKARPAKGVAAQLLNAVRVIGNDGSHDTSKLTRKDIFLALNIIDHVLDETYGKPEVQKELSREAKPYIKTRKPKKTGPTQATIPQTVVPPPTTVP